MINFDTNNAIIENENKDTLNQNNDSHNNEKPQNIKFPLCFLCKTQTEEKLVRCKVCYCSAHAICCKKMGMKCPKKYDRNKKNEWRCTICLLRENTKVQRHKKKHKKKY